MPPSCADLIRASKHPPLRLSHGAWMAGSSPAMTRREPFARSLNGWMKCASISSISICRPSGSRCARRCRAMRRGCSIVTPGAIRIVQRSDDPRSAGLSAPRRCSRRQQYARDPGPARGHAQPRRDAGEDRSAAAQARFRQHMARVCEGRQETATRRHDRFQRAMLRRLSKPKSLENFGEGEVLLAFALAGDELDRAVEELGAMPLPPYIAGKRPADAQDTDDYQSLFATHRGAVAAPTASLHFTPGAQNCDRQAGRRHRGDHPACRRRNFSAGESGRHAARITCTPNGARSTPRPRRGSMQRAPQAAASSRVGTTSLRLLESAATADGQIAPFSGETAIFITPGYRFKAVDLLLTNFHLPRSTLFMLVAAFSGLETMQAAYQHAIASGYRFYSYGDACLLAPGNHDGTLTFDIHAKDGEARTGTLSLPRGAIRTPAFMPVGTAATVKAMYPAGCPCARRRYRARQHLSSDAAAGRRARRRARRPA